MTNTEYSVEVITTSHIIEVGTFSENIASSLTINSTDSATNTFQISVSQDEDNSSYLEVINNDSNTIEVDIFSNNDYSSSIEISDPVSNIVEINSGSSSITNASNIIGLSEFITDIFQNLNTGVINDREYLNVNQDAYLPQKKWVVFVDSNFSEINVYLPSAINFGGNEILVKNIGNNRVTIHASGTETLDDMNNITLNTIFESLTFTSNNNNWYIV